MLKIYPAPLLAFLQNGSPMGIGSSSGSQSWAAQCLTLGIGNFMRLLMKRVPSGTAGEIGFAVSGLLVGAMTKLLREPRTSFRMLWKTPWR